MARTKPLISISDIHLHQTNCVCLLWFISSISIHAFALDDPGTIIEVYDIQTIAPHLSGERFVDNPEEF